MSGRSKVMRHECEAESHDAASGIAANTSLNSSLPPCCNSGCTVCVLDYPELFLSEDDAARAMLAAEEALEALEALEQGGRRAGPDAPDTTRIGQGE
jgi:hypothetical protein